MKASEAKKLSETNMAKIDDMVDVYTVIKVAASNGVMKCFYYKPLTHIQFRTLQRDGYSVENQTDRDGVMYSIKWEDCE